MRSNEIREKFLEYFKKNGHAVRSSSSLVPDDPSVLLTTAGMQQFKRYYTGELDAEKDFGSLSTVSIQKCFRTSDIDEVGDESHLTFFEMLGNFSFGGYFKKEAIRYGFEFITGVMELTIEAVTVFDPAKVPDGDWRKNGVPFDEESYVIWREIFAENGISVDKVKREGVDNFWGPTGTEGPCGPTTEIYVKSVEGKSIEVWNIVFNEFYRDSAMKLTKLPTPGVDTGMGLERLAMLSQNVPTIFDTDLFTDLIGDVLEQVSIFDLMLPRAKRIVLDHLRAIIFLIADGVRPSNKEAEYILRRLMRRVIVYEYLTNDSFLEIFLHRIIKKYNNIHQKFDESVILSVWHEENSKFLKTVQNGIKELNRMSTIDAQSAFKLYESSGLPYEAIKEFGGNKAGTLTRDAFDKEFKKHQEISRAGVAKKFGGHGLILDTGELKAGSEEEQKKVTRLHTATHLLHQALRDVLGGGVGQMGSDITPERTRFDFTFSRKMTDEEKKKVEGIVNQKIAEDLEVRFEEMSKEEAERTGALHFFKEKYPERVKVYYVAPKGKGIETAYSKEFCGGPHVTHTGEIGQFRIAKEEAVGAGTRRIRGVLA
ncbi:MAG: alanine--tRNA ligase-related protein [Patescibacteria group bacterium]